MDNLHLYHVLEGALRMEDQFCAADGQLIKNSIVEAALSLQPRYVTGIGEHKTALWELDKEPLQVSKDFGRDVVLALLLNFWNAGLVEVPIDLHSHPYNYKDYDLKFTEKEKKEDV